MICRRLTTNWERRSRRGLIYVNHVYQRLASGPFLEWHVRAQTASPSIPGWDAEAQPVAAFTDIRDHQRRLKSAGLQLTAEADETTTGAASLMLIAPDGNRS